ncbi:MAG: BtpA/SgcQ family protein, partial [Polyangiales bacterium]
ATLTACAVEARRACDLPIGINVLRNDALSALAVAGAAGASFVRVNVHVGAAVTDQGILQGHAHSTLRARRAWGLDEVDVWADVAVKHAAPLGERPLEDEVHDAILRGLATAILVTGRATGAGAATADIERASGAIGDHDVGLYVASGATPDDLPRLRRAGATGVVVGSWIRDRGLAGGPIDAARAKTFATAFGASFGE